MKAIGENPSLAEIVDYCNRVAREAVKGMLPSWERVKAFSAAWAKAIEEYLDDADRSRKEVTND